MAVTTTAIAGTDSLSGSRITINDNFKTLEDALNSVLSAFDIVSGRFDNSLYGSSNDILTNGLVVNGSGLTNSITINNGNLQVIAGNVTLSDTKGLYLGNLLELNKEDLTKVSAGSYPMWDLRSPGATPDTVGGVVLPVLTGAGYTDIQTAGPTPANGTLVFSDTTTGGSYHPLRLWWDGAGQFPGGTWWKIGATTI